MDPDLRDLQFHWGEAYVILHPSPDVWIAIRKDDQTTFRGSTPDKLREQIHADYFAQPVPRVT
jgi:hypothetical protein